MQIDKDILNKIIEVNNNWKCDECSLTEEECDSFREDLENCPCNLFNDAIEVLNYIYKKQEQIKQ